MANRALPTWRVCGCSASCCGEALLERDELAARVVHEGEEQQSVLGVVAAPEQRDALVLGGDPDVRVGRQGLRGFGVS